MLTAATWNIDPVKILARRELACVLDHRARRSPRSASVRRNRAIFRLACCGGLRVSQIAGLRLDDLCLAPPRPHVRVRAALAKGARTWRVPLWWDAGTLADIADWKEERLRQGARPSTTSSAA